MAAAAPLPPVELPAGPDYATLVVCAAAGDQAAFARLYEQFARPIYNMILRSVRDPQLAEDVAQDVWTKAHRELGKLREPTCFPAWLYRIAAKTCVDAARRRARRPVSAQLSDDLSAAGSDPEGSAIAREDAARVWEALAGLSPKQHMALFLREVEQRSYREIAYVLNISETAVGLCIFRARRSLTSAYGALEHAAPGDACASMQKVMSLRIDGRTTPIQRRALEIHLDRCSPCRSGFATAQVAARAYAGLPLIAVPLRLDEHILGAAAAAKTTAAAGGIGKIVGMLLPQLKAAAIAGSIAATAGVTTVVAAPIATQFVRSEVLHNAQTPDGTHAADDAAAGDDRDASAAFETDGDALGPPPAAATDGGAPLIAPPIVALPGDALVLPDADITLPSADELLDDAVTTVDETLDDALIAVDDTLTTVDDTLTAVDETLAGVAETVSDVTEPILGPPLPATPVPEADLPTVQPDAVIDPLETVVDALPGLP